MITCAVCHQEKIDTEFSTLPRMQGYQLTSIACTPCYWRIMVLEYAEYQPDGRVIYRPKDKPDTQCLEKIKRWLPGWLRDEKIRNKYRLLGAINPQIKPFYRFIEEFQDGNIQAS